MLKDKLKMRNMSNLRISLFITAATLVLPVSAVCQSALGDLERAAGRSIGSVYVPPVSAPSRVGSYGSSGTSGASGLIPSSSSSISNAVAGAVMQGLINNLLSAPVKSQEEIEAERLERERIEADAEKQRQIEAARQLELHNNLINSSKSVSGSQSLDFKSLDGDMENMRKEASDAFDGGSKSAEPAFNYSKGTEFFGVPLSDADMQLVIEPQSDPVYQDVKTAVDLTDEYLKKEKLTVEILSKASKEDKGGPIIEKPDCQALNTKLSRYRSDMIRFNEWNNKTKVELEKWQQQNDDAFWNAVKDGAGAAFGVFLDYLEDTRSSAKTIKKVLEDNESRYLQENIFTADQITEYKKLLDQRITTCNVTKLAKDAMEPWDYVAFARNSLQKTTELLARSDGDCMEIVNVLKSKGYLSDTPGVDAAQFMAGKVIEKFMEDPNVYLKPGSIIKGQMKIPYVTIAQLVVDEAYNAVDWLTSRKNIITLNEADGKATEAVRKIQSDMDNIKLQLRDCP